MRSTGAPSGRPSLLATSGSASVRVDVDDLGTGTEALGGHVFRVRGELKVLGDLRGRDECALPLPADDSALNRQIMKCLPNGRP